MIYTDLPPIQPFQSIEVKGLKLTTNYYNRYIVMNSTKSGAEIVAVMMKILTRSTECARSHRLSWRSPHLYWSRDDIVNTQHRSLTSLHLMLLLLLLLAVVLLGLTLAVWRHHYTRHHQYIQQNMSRIQSGCKDVSYTLSVTKTCDTSLGFITS